MFLRERDPFLPLIALSLSLSFVHFIFRMNTRPPFFLRSPKIKFKQRNPIEYENSNRISFARNTNFILRLFHTLSLTHLLLVRLCVRSHAVFSLYFSVCVCVCVLCIFVCPYPRPSFPYRTTIIKFWKNAANRMTVIFQQNTQSFKTLLRVKKMKRKKNVHSFPFSLFNFVYLYYNTRSLFHNPSKNVYCDEKWSVRRICYCYTAIANSAVAVAVAVCSLSHRCKYLFPFSRTI